jgi:hypothetical protein
MRYEDMLDTPMETFGGLVRFLGLDPPEERLARAIKHASFDELKKQESEKGFVEASRKAESFFRSGRSEQWREDLTKEQIERIVEDHRPQMERFGYVPPEHQ